MVGGKLHVSTPSHRLPPRGATLALTSNLYGPNDNFDPASSHVLPALIRRFHEALKARADEVLIWGSARQ